MEAVSRDKGMAKRRTGLYFGPELFYHFHTCRLLVQMYLAMGSGCNTPHNNPTWCWAFFLFAIYPLSSASIIQVLKEMQHYSFSYKKYALPRSLRRSKLNLHALNKILEKCYRSCSDFQICSFCLNETVRIIRTR